MSRYADTDAQYADRRVLGRVPDGMLGEAVPVFAMYEDVVRRGPGAECVRDPWTVTADATGPHIVVIDHRDKDRPVLITSSQVAKAGGALGPVTRAVVALLAAPDRAPT